MNPPPPRFTLFRGCRQSHLKSIPPCFTLVGSGDVEGHAGVTANLGKTRVYRASGGPPPPDVEALGPDVWCGGDSEPATCGFGALGVPIGHTEFMRRILAARLEEERRLLQELPELPDMQGPWLLLLYCASPRAQHVLRTVPPLLGRLCGRARSGSSDNGKAPVSGARCARTGVGCGAPNRLPPRGIWWPRSNQCGATMAYWAAWADVLPIMLQTRPEATRRYAQELALGGGYCALPAGSCGSR